MDHFTKPEQQRFYCTKTMWPNLKKNCPFSYAGESKVDDKKSGSCNSTKRHVIDVYKRMLCGYLCMCHL